MSWALDLGTTNSGVARWNEKSGQPQMLELSEICRLPEGEDPLEAPRLIPSAMEVNTEPSLIDRIGSWRLFERYATLGRRAWIGRPALERNEVTQAPSFVPSFKPFLSREPLRTLARVGKKTWTARRIGGLYLRELFAAVRRSSKDRIRDLVITVPVDAYEIYRAELGALTRRLGVRRLRFLDEPLAAALGYGLGADRARKILVVDFGGGTLARRAGSPSRAKGVRGRDSVEVLGKEGRQRSAATGGGSSGSSKSSAIAGELQVALPFEPGERLEERASGIRMMLAETCRVKESRSSSRTTSAFLPTPPGRATCGGFDERIRGESATDRTSPATTWFETSQASASSTRRFEAVHGRSIARAGPRAGRRSRVRTWKTC